MRCVGQRIWMDLRESGNFGNSERICGNSRDIQINYENSFELQELQEFSEFGMTFVNLALLLLLLAASVASLQQARVDSESDNHYFQHF